MVTSDEAYLRIVQGEVVAIATDTVFGLAVDFRQEKAVDQLYQLKKRDRSMPLILLGCSKEALAPLIRGSLPSFVDRFWPGPLTVIVEANLDLVPPWIRAGLTTVGVRVPNSKKTLELLSRTGPLAVSSANPSGAPAASTSDEVIERFGKDFPLVEEEAPLSGLASTVISLSPFKVFREGAISKVEIEKVL